MDARGTKSRSAGLGSAAEAPFRLEQMDDAATELARTETIEPNARHRSQTGPASWSECCAG